MEVQRVRFWLGILFSISASSLHFTPLSLGADSPSLGGKSKYGPQATPLSLSHDFFQKNSAPGFWTLIPYYFPQQGLGSCSVASVVQLVNAARVGMKLGAEDPLVQESDLLAKVNDLKWKRSVSFGGRGVALDELGLFVEKSLKVYGIQPEQISVVHLQLSDESLKKKLHDDLKAVASSTRTYILANFNQAAYTGDAEVGHISPVGAYDEKNQRVLVMDVDRKWYEPYWISEETFLRGMATLDPASRRNRGYVRVVLSRSAQPNQ